MCIMHNLLENKQYKKSLLCTPVRRWEIQQKCIIHNLLEDKLYYAPSVGGWVL
jgi:hypothetical protein